MALVTNIINVCRPKAFLDGRKALTRWFFLANKKWLERNHPCTSKEQRGITSGNQRGAGHEQMSLFFEEAKKGSANFIARYGLKKGQQDLSYAGQSTKVTPLTSVEPTHES